MTLDFEADDRPPYLQAAEILRKEITSGRLKPGEKLPSSRTLQERYGIASSTVQNALRLLKREGHIYSVQGRGSFVRTPGQDGEQASERVPEGFDPAPGPLHTDEYNVLAAAVSELSEQVAELKKLLLSERQARPSQDSTEGRE
ncbi:GntR family transcriptional regulator [Streptomyces sp. NPDC058155]|uniref:GntR family transcriptional regulator n=1 Tax=Streptomyces sp. NPDC058155 TaxID=3346359 RepID=UPI0036E4134E